MHGTEGDQDRHLSDLQSNVMFTLQILCDVSDIYGQSMIFYLPLLLSVFSGKLPMSVEAEVKEWLCS